MPRGAGQRGRRRGTYNTTTAQDRERVIAAHENGRDYLNVAEALGISSSTAYSIIARHEQGRPVAAPRGGRREERVILTENLIQNLVNIVEAHPAYTLRQIKAELGDVQISMSSIARGLDGALVTTKKLEDAPVERNSPAVKEQRRIYSQWYMENAVQRTCIYIDETSFNLWTRRTRGRAIQGQRAVRQVLGSRGPNLNLVMAISPGTGVVYYELARGTMTSLKFQHFLDNLEVILEEQNAILIMDNAPVHNNAAIGGLNEVKKLPPYSPMLNPIENAFSALKFAVKAKLNEPHTQQRIFNRQEAAQLGWTLVEHRLTILRDIIVPLIEDQATVSALKCTGWNNHMFAVLPRCMNNDDIFMH